MLQVFLRAGSHNATTNIYNETLPPPPPPTSFFFVVPVCWIGLRRHSLSLQGRGWQTGRPSPRGQRGRRWQRGKRGRREYGMARYGREVSARRAGVYRPLSRVGDL